MSHKRKPRTAQPQIFAPPVPAPVQQPQYMPVPVPAFQQNVIPTAFEVRIQVLTDPHATVAHASLYAGDPYNAVMTASGSSKRDLADEYNEETGTAIAVQRVLVNLSRKIGRKAEGSVKHADDNRRQRDAARAGKDDASGLAAFKALAEEAIAEAAIRPDIIVHMGDSMTEADVPEGLKKMVGNLFPQSSVTFTADIPAEVPDEIAEAVDKLLERPENGVRRERPGKHAKS